MANAAFLSLLPMLAVLAWAAASDLVTRRIPNGLTFGLVAGGLARAAAFHPGIGIGSALLGLLAGAAITMILFGLGALGAGDVKLLAGVGAWLGPTPTLLVFLGAGVIGMVIVVAQAAARGRLRQLWRNSAVLAINLMHADQLGIDNAVEMGERFSAIDRRLPYAVPVFLATLAVVGWLVVWRPTV